MLPPEASGKPQVYGLAGGSVNEVGNVIALQIGAKKPALRVSEQPGSAKLTGGCGVCSGVDRLLLGWAGKRRSPAQTNNVRGTSRDAARRASAMPRARGAGS